MNAVNFVIVGLGPPLWFLAVWWGGLALLLTVPSMVGVIVGLSWGRAVRADRERGDTSSISPSSIGLFVGAWAISVLLVPFVFALCRTPAYTTLGAAVIGFVLNVFLARASVRGRETAAQERGEQAGSGDERARNDSNE